jgi:hypothetical protein
MRKLLLSAAGLVASFGLVTGVAAAHSGGSIDTTGPGSHTKIKSDQRTDVDLDNRNVFRIDNSNSQSASSGDADVSTNTTGGDANTGHASNDSSFMLDGTVDNNTEGSLSGVMSSFATLEDGGSISNTGPNSHTSIESEVRNNLSVSNSNSFHISNTSSQSAHSGDASVSNNTTGGDATTGDAMNTNSSSISLSVSN